MFSDAFGGARRSLARHLIVAFKAVLPQKIRGVPMEFCLLVSRAVETSLSRLRGAALSSLRAPESSPPRFGSPATDG